MQELGVTGAGISVVTTAGVRAVVCATDEVSARIEELQFTLGEGPCVDAANDGVPILVADLQHPGDLLVELWPGFMDGAAAVAVRAVFAFPLRIGAIHLGALDLYRDRPGPLPDVDLSAALVAADAAAIALLEVDATGPGAFVDDAKARSAYQLQVHQATGMVQVQLGIPTQEAFVMLRARAFSTDRPMLEVAQDVVERRLRFSPDDQ